MNRKIYIINSIILFFIIFYGCGILKNRNNVPFLISDASYYSWFAGEVEHGTNIELKLKSVKPDVVFDSLTFRNIRVPVTASEENDEILLQGVIYEGISRLGPDMKRIEESNRLIYTYHGKRYVYILKNIKREKMKYY
jgi:hypothetical protein